MRETDDNVGGTDRGLMGQTPRVSQSSEQPSLFDDRVQPWTHADGSVSVDVEKQRRVLLAALANSEYGTVEQKVAFILQRYPETRNSHTRLAIQYWLSFGADKLADWDRLSLDVLLELENFENIERAARNIQNTLKLWSGAEHYRTLRNTRQLEFYQYFAEQSKGDAEIRLYLDETGTDHKSGYLAVAGICTADWRQYERYHAAFCQWREQLNYPGTLHATEVTEDNTRQLALLAELNKRKGGLLFVAHVMRARAMTHKELESLFVQLALDTLRALDDSGCLNEAKALLVVKEADPGFDNVFLRSLRVDLEEALAADFLNRVYLKNILPVPKGREVMLEAADQIAHALQRRALYGGQNPKDQVAEATMNVTGLEDPREKGIVFKLWQ